MVRRINDWTRSEARNAVVAKALSARRESKTVEFKSEFQAASKGAWCEILKDIIAMANSGGGVIVFGMESAGRPSTTDLDDILGLDPAEIVDKIYAYTGVHFTDFEIVEADKDGRQLALLIVTASQTPIVFTKVGTYDVGGGKQKTAFK